MMSVLVNIVTLALWGVSNESDRNFLKGDTIVIVSSQTQYSITMSSKLAQVTFLEVFIYRCVVGVMLENLYICTHLL